MFPLVQDKAVAIGHAPYFPTAFDRFGRDSQRPTVRLHGCVLVILRLREHVLDLKTGEPLVMGVVNIGDDSVADFNHLVTVQEQLDYAYRQQAAGAHLLDVGLQSGRTDTPVIAEEEEIARLVPVVAALANAGLRVCVEAWRPRVVEAVVAAGASLINDVSGLSDPGVAEIAACFGVGLVVMHTRVAPKVESFPRYDDVMDDVLAFLSACMDRAMSHGVRHEQFLLDPGLDYAKSPEETIAVLRRLDELETLQRPILLAVSRKYFLGMLTGRAPEDSARRHARGDRLRRRRRRPCSACARRG